jgi:hypothetical protein
MNKTKTTHISTIRNIVALLVFFCTVLPSGAQEATKTPLKLDMGSLTCMELMSGNDNDREAGIAYLHGYFAAKKNSPILDIPAATAHTERFFDFCLANPKATVMEAYKKSAN